MKKSLVISIDGIDRTVAVEKKGSEIEIVSGDSHSTIVIDAMTAEDLTVLIDGHRAVVPYLRRGSAIEFQYEGEVWNAEVSQAGGKSRKKQKDHSLSAPMPGVVLKIFAAPGDVVSKGAPLLILEAMKMEHGINAPYDGTVSSVNCAVGELVQPGVDLIDLAPKEPA